MYRVAYDVLEDVTLPAQQGGVVFLGFALVWTVAWVAFHRFVRGMPTERRRNLWPGLVAGVVLVGVGAVVVATQTYPMFVDQRRCKDWARGGDFQTVEGPVTRVKREGGKNPPRHFQVGDIDFTYRVIDPETGGFHGEFTAPWAQDLQLRDGLPVRVAFRDGRILRIDVAE